MKKLFAFLLAAALAATFAGPFTATAQSSGTQTYTIDFEQGTAADYFVDTNSGRNAKYSLESVTGRDGSQTRAAKIDGSVNPTTTTNLNQNLVGAAPNAEKDPYFCGATVTAGKTYRLSAWVKLDTETVTEKPTAELVYSYYKDEAKSTLEFKTIKKTYGNYYDFSTMLYSDNRGLWTELVTYFTVSSALPTQSVGLSLYFGNTLKGVAWLDDVQLTELAGSVLEFSAPQTAQAISFDDARPYSFNRSRFEIVPAAGRNASSALMLRQGSYSNTAVLNQPTTMDNQTDPALSVPVRSGHEYVISAYARIESTAADLSYACLIGTYKAAAGSQSTQFTQEFQKQLNADKGEWVQIVATLKPEFTDPQEVRRLGLSFNFGKEIAANVYLDDITVTDVTQTVNEAFSPNTTVQIRKAAGEVSQALRFKITVNRSKLALPGYELVEYGCLTTLQKNRSDFGVTPSYFAEGNSKTVAGTDGKTKRVYIGRAFVKATGTDLIFSQKDDGSLVYTAALTNIGLKSNGEMNYSLWGADYYVLPYVVLKNAKNETVVYYPENAAASASVFGVMQAILNGENQSDDREYVQGKLENADIQLAYNSYCNAAENS